MGNYLKHPGHASIYLMRSILYIKSTITEATPTIIYKRSIKTLAVGVVHTNVPKD